MNKMMKSVYIKEECYYNLEQLINLFGYDVNDTKKTLSTFKNYGILKVFLNNNEDDYIDEDKHIINIDSDINSKYLYKFTFVGVFKLDELILKCYPKYISEDKISTQLLKQVIKVIGKFQDRSRKNFYGIQNIDQNSNEFNLFETILFLLNDYYEFGEYNRLQDVYEINGKGEINWDKTINNKFTLITKNELFYPELITKKRIVDNNNFIKRIHQVILTQCSNNLKSLELLELFDLQEVNLTDENIIDLGDSEYILDKLDKERKKQYNTRKIMLLEVMYNYIKNINNFEDHIDFSFYGTNSFHVIWENVCKEILDNKLMEELRNICLPKNLSSKFKRDEKLIDLIEKPRWEIDKKNFTSKKSLEPDGISIYKDKNQNFRFLIFDAKYRIIKSSPKMTGHPGIGEITKQYLYQLAYSEFISEHDFEEKNVLNCFLLPTEKDNVENRGTVNLGIFKNSNLKNIQLVSLPAKKVFDLFLENKKVNDINEII